MTDPDLTLALSARDGDTSAFGELVGRHQAMLAGLLHRFSVTSADLEDMVQDTFIKAWRALPDWEPRQPFSHWLKRIGVRTGLEFCRKNRRSRIDFRSEPPDAEAAPESPAEALGEAQALLAMLPPEDRALLTLIHLDGMSMEEAASHFGWSRANAKIKAFRARHSLRKILERHGYRPD